MHEDQIEKIRMQYEQKILSSWATEMKFKNMKVLSEKSDIEILFTFIIRNYKRIYIPKNSILYF